MKKIFYKITILCFVLIMILNVNISASDYELNDYPIFYNNTRLKFNNPVIQINNMTYVPLREYNKFINIETNWNEEKNNIITSSNNIAHFEGKGTEDEPIHASIISLITNPDIFQDKYVTIVGVGNIEYEANAIFLGYNDWDYGIYKNGIALCLNDIEENLNLDDMKKLNGKYVEVSGIFDKNYSGIWGLFSGSIHSIGVYNERENSSNS